MEGTVHAEEDSSHDSHPGSQVIDEIADGAETSEHLKLLKMPKGVVDTAAPIDSVKSAVNRFGGIVDWKAHKIMSIEKHTIVQSELEKIHEEIPKYREQAEAAQVAKDEVLEELNNIKRVIEELKLNLEKTTTEEAEAKQDSELAQLRVREMEQGISDDHSAVAKAQVEIAQARHGAAVDELKSVKEELVALEGDYQRLVNERDTAVSRAEEATSVSKTKEKQVEDLTLELITIKGAFESAHSLHLELEDRRMEMERNQDNENSEAQLKQVMEEIEEFDKQNLSIKDLESKLDTASATLLDLKTELSSKMATGVHAELVLAKREIVRLRDEVGSLTEVASSLQAQMDQETESIMTLGQKEGETAETLSSLEAELAQMQSELAVASAKEKEAKEKMEEFSQGIEQATQEANEAKSVVQSAHEELQKVKHEAEEAKNNVSKMEERIVSVHKEIDAAKASEELAKRAVVRASGAPPSDDGVTIELEKYYELIKTVHETEQLSNERVINAIEEIKQVKKREAEKLEELEEAIKELEVKKGELKEATEEVDRANERKIAAEQELRDWRAETEQKRRASDGAASDSESGWDEKGEGSRNAAGERTLRVPSASCPDLYADHSEHSDHKPRRRKQYFPRFVMFLAKKKAQSLK